MSQPRARGRLAVAAGGFLVVSAAAAVVAGRYPSVASVILAAATGVAAAFGIVGPEGFMPAVAVGGLAAELLVVSPARPDLRWALITSALAAALWVAHTLYAVAAALPAHSTVDPAVLVRAGRRICETLLVSGVAALLGALVIGYVPAPTWARALGSLAALAILTAPLFLVRRSAATDNSS